MTKAVPTVQEDNDRVRVTNWWFAPGAETGSGDGAPPRGSAAQEYLSSRSPSGASQATPGAL